jgi:hypothetical protein
MLSRLRRRLFRANTRRRRASAWSTAPAASKESYNVVKAAQRPVGILGRVDRVDEVHAQTTADKEKSTRNDFLLTTESISHSARLREIARVLELVGEGAAPPSIDIARQFERGRAP